MKKQAVFPFLIIAFIFSCNQQQNPKQPAQVGDFDSSAIAHDTLMQKGFESSYEYSTSLTVSEKLVYDIRAYGGPASAGEFAILRRGADNRADTVVKDKRDGIIAMAFIADLNTDHHEEVYLFIKAPGGNTAGKILGFEFGSDGKATPLGFEHLGKMTDYYRGKDTLYLTQNMEGKNFLTLQFPAYRREDSACCPTAGEIKIFYHLNRAGKLAPQRIETADSTKKLTGIKL